MQSTYVTTFQGHKGAVVSLCAVEGNSFAFASLSEDRSFRLWDVRDSKKLVSVSEGAIAHSEFSNMVAEASRVTFCCDTALLTYDLRTNKIDFVRELGDACVNGICLNEKKNALAFCTDA